MNINNKITWGAYILALLLFFSGCSLIKDECKPENCACDYPERLEFRFAKGRDAGAFTEKELDSIMVLRWLQEDSTKHDTVQYFGQIDQNLPLLAFDHEKGINYRIENPSKTFSFGIDSVSFKTTTRSFECCICEVKAETAIRINGKYEQYAGETSYYYIQKPE